MWPGCVKTSVTASSGASQSISFTLLDVIRSPEQSESEPEHCFPSCSGRRRTSLSSRQMHSVGHVPSCFCLAAVFPVVAFALIWHPRELARIVSGFLPCISTLFFLCIMILRFPPFLGRISVIDSSPIPCGIFGFKSVMLCVQFHRILTSVGSFYHCYCLKNRTLMSSLHFQVWCSRLISGNGAGPTQAVPSSEVFTVARSTVQGHQNGLFSEWSLGTVSGPTGSKMQA